MLFDNQTKTVPAKTPIDVIRQLVEFGMTESAARRLPVRAAFAKLYAFRESGLTVSQAQAKREANRLAKLIRDLTSESEPCPHELVNAALESLATMPPQLLKRVCAGIANVLDEVSAPRNAA